MTRVKTMVALFFALVVVVDYIKGEGYEKFHLFLRLKRAVEENDRERVRTLLMEGADPNIAMNNVYNVILSTKAHSEIEPQTLLGIAVRQSSEAILRLLLTGEAKPDEPIDSEGRRPLHAAIDRGNLGIVKALVNRGADIHVRWEGETLLHHAISGHQVEMVELLLKSGVDPQIKDDDGKDALEASRSAWCRGCEISVLEMSEVL